MKIEVLYSDIYDTFVQYAQKKKKVDYAKLKRSGKAFAKKLQKEINRNERIFSIMSKVSGLKWRESKVKVYVVHNIEWDFSDPVTILVRKNMADAFETTVHEFSHQIIIQNWNRYKKNSALHTKKYKKEHLVVHQHFLAHAILYKTYNKFFGAKKTQKIIKSYKNWKWHYRAWQIVLKEGADNIIKACIR